MSEAEALAELHASAFSPPRPWTGAEIAALLESPHVHLCRESAGFLLGRVIAGEAELLTLAVEPAARRQGIGQRLVTAWHQLAQTHGAQTFFLEVAANNPAAIALYQQAGYRQTGRRKGYYRQPDGGAVDALVLARTPE